MADNKTQKREQLRQLVHSVFTDELPAEQVEAFLDGLAKIGDDLSKPPTRTKSFRLPTELLDWLEAQANASGRSPNAELILLLQTAYIASNGKARD